MRIKKPFLSLLLPPFFTFFFLASSDLLIPQPPFTLVTGGWWQTLQQSIGISAMHMQLLHNNKVVIFDRTNMGPSNLTINTGIGGQCFSPGDCSAHSVLYDILSNTFRPLTLRSDTWCSSGSLNPDGILIQTGGYSRGERAVRTFTPCDETDAESGGVLCDWNEWPYYLSYRRWYATNQILPDGRVIVIGGRRAFTYEFFPKPNRTLSDDLFKLRFLAETRDGYEENNLYPFVHLLPDGNLYIFANKRSILYDHVNHCVIKEFPVIPGGDKRNYPSTGSSVLLPLDLNGKNSTESVAAEVLICGGAPAGAFLRANQTNRKELVEASRTCGRLRITDPVPKWEMEVMPMPRVMLDLIMLPNGDVLIINGATNGTAGWENGRNAVLNPVLYKPFESPSRRFRVLAPTQIPRMYHSSVILLTDGRVLVGGSNPHRTYNFTVKPYPTELSLEAYNPSYLNPAYNLIRPSIVSIELTRPLSYNEPFSISFGVSLFSAEEGVSVSLVAPSFNTHSVSMNQRLVALNVRHVSRLSVFDYKIELDGPISATVAPPGWYMMFVVHSGIPSMGVWVKVAYPSVDV